ncbi:hypothetical protein BKA64DRAFT_31206 [Cadophora sp. MPI-SDFR-AT-0126]|nr:hypothetical protein BKA64DRAFT_31206 [Leotiomycetes sp. MPI-SDFR-AT-0126]
MLSTLPYCNHLSNISVMIVFGISMLLVVYFQCFIVKKIWTHWIWTKKAGPKLDFRAVPALNDFDMSKTTPRAYRPWKAGKYNMTMGIRKMPEEDWLVIDNLYKKEQEVRLHLLQTNYEGVLQCLPSATDACKEALESIVNFLIQRYPLQFWIPKSKPGYVHNAITSKTFRFIEPYDQHPLAIAAQLAMEDINLLMQGTGDAVNEHFLQASYSFAPAGWYIQQRIGWPLWKIHKPVPFWDQRLRKAMENHEPSTAKQLLRTNKRYHVSARTICGFHRKPPQNRRASNQI